MVVSDKVYRLADRPVVVVAEAQQPALPLEALGMPGTIEEMLIILLPVSREAKFHVHGWHPGINDRR